MGLCNWFINRINWNPVFSILIASLSKLRGGGLQLHNFTTSHYEALFTIGSPGLEALWNSFLFTYNSDYCCYDWRLLALMIRKGKSPLKNGWICAVCYRTWYQES